MLRRCLGLFALSLAACDAPAPAGPTGIATEATPAPPPSAPPKLVSTSTSSARAVTSATPVYVPAATPPTNDELKAYAQSNNAFAADVFSKARAQKGNIAFSPFSISTALLMTWAGARGDTEKEMRKVLHLTAAGDRPLEVAGSLIASYGAPDQKITVRVANRLFGERSASFEAPYLARMRSAFGAPLEPIDFKGASEDGRTHINGWVADQTQGRIKDLIPPGALNAQTRLVLTNAIYFLGDWATTFDKSRTGLAPFFTSKADQKPVLTMHLTEGLRYATVPGAKVLEMPYQNGALAMTFVLPDAVDGLDALESKLTPAALEAWTRGLTSTKVIVSLPKFTIEPGQGLSLGDTLSSLGMPIAFDRGRADFTGIASPKDPAERLFISSVFHKAFVKVDEKGTEAAAATAVVMEAAGAAPPSAAPPEFKADHPFVFLLRDTRTGLVLFMGRVADPVT